jgi:hypothetical protein
MEVRERYQRLLSVALDEFSSIVAGSSLVGGTVLKPRVLRLHLFDQSYLDIRLAADGYAFHWERRALDGLLYRWDDAPHHREIGTFPHHLHNGSELAVVESQLPVDSSESALRHILGFIENRLDENRS